MPVVMSLATFVLGACFAVFWIVFAWRKKAPDQQGAKTRVRVQLLREGAALPVYSSAQAAGADLRACVPERVLIAPGQTSMIPTGLAIELPEGYAGLVYARSGLAGKRGLAPANKVGVIDADYRGEILVALHNHGAQSQIIEPGERIAQLVLARAPRAEFVPAGALSDTDRGSGGFGSTGK